jgi:hypothetical protein
MNEQLGRDMEHEIERAISAVVRRIGLKRLPLLPTPRTTHLMPNSAVTVSEATGENAILDRPPPDAE